MEEDYATHEKGTVLSGDNVLLNAGNDLTVRGSTVVGDGQVTLKADNNIDIFAATEEQSLYRLNEKKTSGVFSGGGIGVTIGSKSSRHQLNEDGTTQSQSVSTIGSTGGSVDIEARSKVHISGADVIADKNLSVTGDSVHIDPGKDIRRRDEAFEQKQSGLSLALSGTVGSAINSAVTTAQQAKQETDGRLAALQGAKAALSGVQAAQAGRLAKVGDTDTEEGSMVGISISLGGQKSSSKQHQEQTSIAGSTFSAGNNMQVTATGKGNTADSGDIVVVGSQFKVAGNTTLAAERDILLLGAANTQKTEGSNKSSGGNIGVSIGVGKQTGLSVFANANKSQGSEHGDGTFWTETTIDTGGVMSMRSTRDTLLSGAQISGERVEVDTGGNLIMQSQQDSDNYDAKQSSVSGGVSVAIFGAGGSASLSMSRDKLHSNYDSVQEQTGIFAGKGGYDIKVNQHTQLDGAVIASTATPEKNRLDTGTLGFSDIHNQADFKAEHQGGSISSGGPVGSDLLTNLAGAALSGAGNKGHAEGTTKAAVSGGSVVIRDGANQQQDVNALSRDTDNANSSIGPIFDKEKEQNRLKQAQLIGEIAGQTMDIVRTQGDINGLQKAKDKHPGLDATALRKTPEYQAEMQKYGTGSDMQRAAQAVTGALQALAGNNLAGALASGAAPYLAKEIKARVGENNVAANAMAHALLGAITAQLNNQSAVAGAVGAGGGELAARVITEIRFPGRDINSLSEGEKQEVSALSQLAAGLAGGIASDSTAGAVTASQAGKNAVENNLLGGNEETQTKFVQDHGKNIASCSTDPGSASCQKGLAMNDALMVALPAGLGGGLLTAATPEIAAAAKAAIQACAGNVVLCLNNAGIQMSEAIVPGGVGAGGAVGIGKTAAEATAAKAEAVAANAAKNVGNGSAINSITNRVETQVSVDQKLANYLLDKQHPIGGSKAEWFDSALGFNKTNLNELAKQIVFDSSKAVKTAETQFGTKYDQLIPITGKNGRTINVKFGWIENNDGVVRLVTAIPAKK